MLGARFLGGSFAGAGCAGVSSGKERSRLRPEASGFSGGEDGGAEGGAELCCAHTIPLNPSSKHKHKYGRRCMSLFYRCNRTLWKGVFRHKAFGLFEASGPAKKQAAQGEALSGLVGEVLRGRRNCYLPTTTTRDYSARWSLVSLRAGSCRPLCSSSGAHPRGGCQRGLLWSCWFPPACPCPAR